MLWRCLRGVTKTDAQVCTVDPDPGLSSNVCRSGVPYIVLKHAIATGLAVEALDAGVPPLLEQLAQQLSAVGSVMNGPFLSAVRRGHGVELLTSALHDACQDEPQALEALIEREALSAARVAYQSAAFFLRVVKSTFAAAETRVCTTCTSPSSAAIISAEAPLLRTKSRRSCKCEPAAKVSEGDDSA